MSLYIDINDIKFPEGTQGVTARKDYLLPTWRESSSTGYGDDANTSWSEE